MSKKIVLASNNKKKMKEMQELLAPMSAEVVSQGSLGIPSAEEPFGTFVENALAKARWAAKHSGLPAIADDSGICSDALKGAPGVLSARFAGEPSSDAANNAKLIKELEDKDNRNAHYTCERRGRLRIRSFLYRDAGRKDRCSDDGRRKECRQPSRQSHEKNAHFINRTLELVN